MDVQGLGRNKKAINIVLWAVVASLAIGSLASVVFSPGSVAKIKIAKVNGSPILFDRYRKELIALQDQLSSIKQMAKMYGLSEAAVLQAYGFNNPQVKALDTCIREKLYDQVKHQLGIGVDAEWFKLELIKTMPQFIGQDGRINITMYHNYLQRLAMTPVEFETRRAEEIKRDMVFKFLQQTAYVPNFVAKEAYIRDEVKRSFAVATVKLEHFLALAKKAEHDDKELEAFYLTNKEKYRIPEKRKATYWELDTKKVTNAIDVDQAAIMNFYEKHKATTYRIPPKVKVRHILIKSADKKASAKAADVLKQAHADPAKFASLVKQYSEDEASVAQGGLVDLSTKGTRDPEFEKAAFRLKNKGELSPVVQTSKGYEIIQLVDRVNASEKPFESVSDEIKASLKAKRAMGQLRSELEQLVRSAKGDAAALASFAKKYNLVAKETASLTEADIKDAGVDGLIARKLFSGQDRANGVGYFSHEESYVIFQATAVKKSHISSFDNIKQIIAHDYVEDQARVMARRALKEAYAAVLDGKKNLHEIASELGGTHTVTGHANKAKELKEFESEKVFKDRLFSLTDAGHVLFFATDNNFYLAKIKDMEELDKSEFVVKRAQFAKKEASKIASLQAGAFIASLHRNAKIEIEDKRLLDMQPEQEKD